MKISLIQQKYLGSKEGYDFANGFDAQERKRGACNSSGTASKRIFGKSEDTSYFDYAESFEQDVESGGVKAKRRTIVLVASLLRKVMAGFTTYWCPIPTRG